MFGRLASTLVANRRFGPHRRRSHRPCRVRCPWSTRTGCDGTGGRRPSSSNPAGVLDVVGQVRLPQQQRRRSVGLQAQFGEEVGVAGGHEGIGGDEAGRPVVGMEPVAAPGVVPEHDGRPYRAEDPGHRPPFVDAVVELAVDRRPRNTHRGRSGRGVPGARPSMMRADVRHSSARSATRVARSASGSQLPLEPSVRTRWWTRHPAAAHLASVAPQPNSMSSGWAPMARALAGTGRSTVAGTSAGRSPTGSPLAPVPAAGVRCPGTRGGRRWPPARCRRARPRPRPGRAGRAPGRAARAARASARWRAKEPGP